jgi:hypothetical protein
MFVACKIRRRDRYISIFLGSKHYKFIRLLLGYIYFGMNCIQKRLRKAASPNTIGHIEPPPPETVSTNQALAWTLDDAPEAFPTPNAANRG